MKHRAFIRRRPLLSLLLMAGLLLMGWVWQQRLALQAFPDILGAYTAKEYCSCRYVMQHTANDCRAYVRQYLPLSDFSDDTQSRRVTASALGRSHSALWLGPREGCRLDP
ncbi:amidase [Pseudomonas sp. LD120]|uniref:amidase n=1 Tax=Pseudomonas sp. LD120 TaxID=485751 RepID=UPI001359B8FF|nr:amidase [Pseudomonas sp. LD120]KAF0863342.1 amidase [Pseudomonas sp. LD120]